MPRRARSVACPSWSGVCTTRRIPHVRNLFALFALCATASADPKRAMPDYDGRGNAEVGRDPPAIWIPRVLLAPLYALHEYAVRRPLGAVVRHADTAHWFGRGDEAEEQDDAHARDAGHVRPILRYESGLLPHAGVDYARAETFVPHNLVQLSAATWGPAWLDLAVADRYELGPRDRPNNAIVLRGEFARTKDNLFYGVGPDVVAADRARYGLETVEGSLAYRRGTLEAPWLRVEGGIQRLAIIEGACCDDPSLDQRIAAGAVAPPGYRDAYTAAFARAVLTLDSRAPRPAAGSGAYLQLHAGASYADRGWFAYGGAIGGAVDLTGHQRTIKLSLALDFVDGSAVPFTAYASLGGDAMPGFAPGWMIGRSTAVAQLGYSWPIWAWLDGQTRFSAGNAFDAHLAGLSPRKLRFSGDFGIATSNHREAGYELAVGLGTETMEQGTAITSVRVVFGSRRGF